MSRQFDAEAKVVNEHWEGKYVLVCDVILGKRVVSGVSVSASPPVKEAEVFLPTNPTLTPDEEGKIRTAALSFYYGIDSSV